MSWDYTPVLTTHMFITGKNSIDGLEELIKRLDKSCITVKLYGPEDALLNINPKKPRVYVSLGEDWEEFNALCALPFYERKRWLHFISPTEIQPSNLFYCWLQQTDPLPGSIIIPSTLFSSNTPLVSVFTACYLSKEKIKRPYHSLLNQTYSNWEWVIVDDSDDEDETYNQYLLDLDDRRVRRYRQDSHNGYIGAIKRYAAGLCTGEILVEMDHDDELTPDCLEKLVQAFQEHTDCGFVYGENVEVHEENFDPHWYGWDCGFGSSIYYRVWVHEMNRWQNVMKQTVVNSKTIRHLVGLPNHPRAWSRNCYHLIGGHREELMVSDDYDLLIRTFLSTKFVAIPRLLYFQYRNKNGENSTFKKNQQIQILCRELESYYHQRINKRITELSLPENLEYSHVWESPLDHPARKSAHIIHEDISKVSFLFPIPFSCSFKKHNLLFNTIQKGINTNFKEIEVVVVGRVPLEIETFASVSPMGAIRWWNMKPDDTLETCIQYAKFCSSCQKKVVILPND